MTFISEIDFELSKTSSVASGQVLNMAPEKIKTLLLYGHNYDSDVFYFVHKLTYSCCDFKLHFWVFYVLYNTWCNHSLVELILRKYCV